MITTDNLSYRYPRGVEAVSPVTTVIPEGIHLLMGENGAGKTTLLHLIAGLLTPTTGSVAYESSNTRDRNPKVMADLFLLEENMRFPARSINEWARVHACFYPRFSAERLAENLRLFGLTGDEKLSSLSLGLEKKSRLAYALSLGVSLLMLDEPTNGIDLTARGILRRLIAESMTDGSTVIIATHTVQDFDSLFDSILLMHRSRLIVNMPTWQIGERLLFTADTLPAYKPLYQEMDGALYRSIRRNTSSEESAVDIRLLFNALQSLSRPQILKALSDEQQ